MTKSKYLIIILVMSILLFCVFNVSKATEVRVTRDVYSNDGSMKFNFTGLTLDKTHQYEFGFTKTKTEKVGAWHQITEYTTSTAVIDILRGTKELREVINATDTGYITIKDKTANKVILEPYSVDLKIPYLRVTNYAVIPNGKEFDIMASIDKISIPSRNASNSKAYYQYEKITDQNIINKYKEIKSKGEDIMKIENMLKTIAPSSNWSSWGYWQGFGSDETKGGYGYTQRTISAPDTGLYYMWVYFSGNNIKNIYGYILVDNLEPDIALEGISLPKTETVELGKTIILKPTYNPTSATNKIITWSSSDETVATVDNTGKVTPKKVGSTVITVISQDGNRKATCTVTVTAAGSNGNQNSNTGNNGNQSSNTGNNSTSNIKPNSSSTSGKQDDKTTASGKLPQTGIGFGLIFIIFLLIGGSVFAYIRYSRLRGV